MRKVHILNDWKCTTFSLFYFSVIRFEVSLGRIALLYFCIEPAGTPKSYLITFYILGVGICLSIGSDKRR